MEERFVKMGFLFMGCIILLCSIGLALEQYGRNQCRIEALRALVKPELISEICK